MQKMVRFLDDNWFNVAHARARLDRTTLSINRSRSISKPLNIKY
jgi:hypothetical protein